MAQLAGTSCGYMYVRSGNRPVHQSSAHSFQENTGSQTSNKAPYLLRLVTKIVAASAIPVAATTRVSLGASGRTGTHALSAPGSVRLARPESTSATMAATSTASNHGTASGRLMPSAASALTSTKFASRLRHATSSDAYINDDGGIRSRRQMT